MTIRSAGKLRSASSIASSGSLSPVSPCAGIPASSRRSTVSLLTCAAFAIASSASDSQNLSADSCSAGATTATSLSCAGSASPSADRSWSAEIGSELTTSTFIGGSSTPRWLLETRSVIPPATRVDHFASDLARLPAPDLDRLAFTLLVDAEEVLDLSAQLLGDVLDPVVVHPVRVPTRDAQDLVVWPFLIAHPPHADRLALDHSAG